MDKLIIDLCSKQNLVYFVVTSPFILLPKDAVSKDKTLIEKFYKAESFSKTFGLFSMAFGF